MIRSESYKLDISKYVYNSINGSTYDIANLVYYLYNDKYVVARIKNKLWYHYDGMKWKATEIGPYYELSSDVVKIYENYIEIENENKEKIMSDSLNCETEHERSNLKNALDKLNSIIGKMQDIIKKLKNVNIKEQICKECLYLFYDPDFLHKLDKNFYLVCFQNGVLDLNSNEFRQGNPDDLLSIMIEKDFLYPRTMNEKKDMTKIIDEFNNHRVKVINKRKSKVNFAI
jgi:phage/plasmid-associated DNA primase